MTSNVNNLTIDDEEIARQLQEEEFNALYDHSPSSIQQIQFDENFARQLQEEEHTPQLEMLHSLVRDNPLQTVHTTQRHTSSLVFCKINVFVCSLHRIFIS
jgi:hypothetical protein